MGRERDALAQSAVLLAAFAVMPTGLSPDQRLLVLTVLDQVRAALDAGVEVTLTVPAAFGGGSVHLQPGHHPVFEHQPFFRRGSALMPTAMARGLGYNDAGYNADLIAFGDAREEFVPRASGDAICSVCHYALRMHPPVQGALFLTRTCTGLVKL